MANRTRSATVVNRPASLTGCWTCKLRRKRCEGSAPICSTCAMLDVPCHFQAVKPEWMDGGLRQEEMARTLKTQIKEHGHQRRAKRFISASTSSIPDISSEQPGAWIVFSQTPTIDLDDSPDPAVPLQPTYASHAEAVPDCPPPLSTEADNSSCALARKSDLQNRPMGRAESNLMVFYLDNLFPFLFPFYQPSVLQGGRAWVLDLMLKSPVVRQAMFCQSSYYLSLVQGNTDSDAAFETVLTQTRDVFHILGQTLSLIETEGIPEHIHGAVRTFVSIMQLQRFEAALSSFSNCQAHLNACISLFWQLLDIAPETSSAPSLSFGAVLNHLGPSSIAALGQINPVASSEQDAFRFTSALLIFDDIVASTVLQQRPQLYEFHASLLAAGGGVDMKAVTGCDNLIILRIGEIAQLDAWKQESQRAGSLDIVELVQRAMLIKSSIEDYLCQTLGTQTMPRPDTNVLLNALSSTSNANGTALSSSLVGKIWAHAAILYLSIVLSGWQSANTEVRGHVQQALGLMSRLAPSSLLRTVCWPFCVAGCLAEPAQETQFRGLVQTLHPQSVFGTLYQALAIMENVWQERDQVATAPRDLASCFRCRGDLVLLV